MLVHDVLIHRELPIIEGMWTEKTMTAMQTHHTVSDQVGIVANEVGAGKIVLSISSHLNLTRKNLLDEVRQGFKDPIIFG